MENYQKRGLMDTYTKMCSKLPELQGELFPQVLIKPDLEQLIGMLVRNLPEVEQKCSYIEIVVLDDFSECVLRECPDWISGFDTIKEALLAYTAHELWHKTWKGDKWV